MVWYALQLLALLVAAWLLGILIGWLVWARSQRVQGAAHGEQVNVLHKQLASLADEGRRTQQRFASVAADLDATKLAMQERDAELQRARDAFAVSQQNVASAESELAQAHRSFAGVQSELTARRNEAFSETPNDSPNFVKDSSKEQELQASLDAHAAVASDYEHRYMLQQATLSQSERDLSALRVKIAEGTQAYELAVKQRDHLRAALDAAVDRANEAGAPPKLASSTAEPVPLPTATSAAEDPSTSEAMRADVLGLATSWRIQSERRSKELDKQAKELDRTRRQLRESESVVSKLRGSITDQLLGVQTVAQRVAQDTAQKMVAQATHETASQLATLNAAHQQERNLIEERLAERSEVQMSEQRDAHQLAIEHWQRDLSLRNQEIDVLSLRAQAVQGDLATTQADFERVAYERHMLDEAHDRAQSELSRVIETVNEKEAQIDALHVELRSSRSFTSQTQEQLGGLHATRVRLEAELAEMHSSRAGAQTQLQQVSERAASLQQSLQHRFDEVEQSRLDLARQYDESLVAIGILRNKHNTALSTMSTLSQQLTDHAADAENTISGATAEARSWERELLHLRETHARTIAQSASQRAIHLAAEQARVAMLEEPTGARRAKLVTQAGLINRPAVPVVPGVSASSNGSPAEPRKAESAKREQVADDVAPARAGSRHGIDDLQRVEGIGPKISSALQNAGIGTFVRLASASDDRLRDALASAGLTFAPSLTTWATQAGLIVSGDEAGLTEFQTALIAGRQPAHE
jgi:predicted flap endonuclease-1-like 5' DNA nuclease/predicted  nucleic acid-binding Zn-ribbon protein